MLKSTGRTEEGPRVRRRGIAGVIKEREIYAASNLHKVIAPGHCIPSTWNKRAREVCRTDYVLAELEFSLAQFTCFSSLVSKQARPCKTLK